MDASTFRWVLVLIAVVAVLFIYLYGRHQSRLRRRAAVDSFTREEIESAFIEDEELRDELENLNRILKETEDDEPVLHDIELKPALEAEETPFALPDPDMFLPPDCSDNDGTICYLLRHSDFRLMTGEEVGRAVKQIGLQAGAEGYMEYVEAEQLMFRVCSLSPPGSLSGCDELEFSTVGLVCFINPESVENAVRSYEVLLKKVDELVRSLDVKVFKANQELLTISDVTETRERLGAA